MAQLAINATMSVATIVEPTGVPAKMDSKIEVDDLFSLKVNRV